MQQPVITVYNPNSGPVIVDDARCVAGYEKTTVDKTLLVMALIADGILLDKDAPSPKPVVDGSAVVTPVVSEVEDAPEDEPTEPQPQTASTRRRKSPPVKE